MMDSKQNNIAANTDGVVASAPSESPLPVPVSGTADSESSAIMHAMSHLRLWPVAAIGLAIDLWTKHWAFTSLDPDEPMVIIPGLMTFRRSLNSGALFGMGKGLTPVFIAASFLALGFVLYLFAQSSRRRWSLHVALGLVLGGAVGNLYDRVFVQTDVITYVHEGRTWTSAGLIIEEKDGNILLAPYPEKSEEHASRILSQWGPQIKRQGVVRDFIKMEPKIGKFEWWPWVFNIADSLLVVGVCLLLLNFWKDRQAEKAAHSEAERQQQRV